MLDIGDDAPNFELPNQDGNTVRLKDYIGKPVVLYFYPKDDTPGCTQQACQFRDSLQQFDKKGAIILGVSLDSVESHYNFIEKYKLPFDLLSDRDKKVSTAYGVLKQTTKEGKTVQSITRTTFLIDRWGKIKSVFPDVVVDKHHLDVLRFI